MSKNLTTIVSIAIIGGLGYYFYREWRNKKIDDTPVSYSDAIKRLEELKK